MKFVTIFAAAALCSAALGDYYSSYNTRTCTETNARCAGAPGKPFIKYAPCCESGKACMPKPSPSSSEWGRYCIDPPASEASKCYNTGERCMGAPGYPYVAYRKCCNSGESCQKVDGEWGGFCNAGYAPSPDSPQPKTDYEGNKCYSTGDRCMGAPGKPYVAYHKCCTPGESCKPKDGDWGGFCMSASDAPATTTAPADTTAAPATERPKEYYSPTMAPTMPPTMPSTMPKNYYTYAPDMTTATELNELQAALPGLPADFGCGAPDGSTATEFVPPPESDEVEITITVPVDSADACGATASSIPSAAAIQFKDAVCDQVRSTGADAECFLQAVSTGSTARFGLENVRMVQLVRQGGITILFEVVIQIPEEDLELLIAALELLESIPGIEIVGLPSATDSP